MLDFRSKLIGWNGNGAIKRPRLMIAKQFDSSAFDSAYGVDVGRVGTFDTERHRMVWQLAAPQLNEPSGKNYRVFPVALSHTA